MLVPKLFARILKWHNYHRGWNCFKCQRVGHMQEEGEFTSPLKKKSHSPLMVHEYSSQSSYSCILQNWDWFFTIDWNKPCLNPALGSISGWLCLVASTNEDQAKLEQIAPKEQSISQHSEILQSWLCTTRDSTTSYAEAEIKERTRQSDERNMQCSHLQTTVNEQQSSDPKPTAKRVFCFRPHPTALQLLPSHISLF